MWNILLKHLGVSANIRVLLKLITKLLKVEHRDVFINKNKDINALMIDMGKRNIPNSKQEKLSKALNALAEDLSDNFNFEKIQSWIKD